MNSTNQTQLDPIPANTTRPDPDLDSPGIINYILEPKFRSFLRPAWQHVFWPWDHNPTWPQNWVKPNEQVKLVGLLRKGEM